MSDRLDHQVRAYLRHERNELFRNEVLALRQANNSAELQRLFGGRLTFGTAGIRGAMGAGFNRINDLVVVQTVQGLVSYLLEVFGPEVCKRRGLVIGHDARHHSSRFARLAALACLQRKLPVFFADHIVPTPLIAFGVTHFNCLAGLMITASHNPKQDNGLKVFWSNGAQILSPHDVNIQAHIMLPENQVPWSSELSYAHGLIAAQDHVIQKQQMPIEMRNSLHLVYEDLRRSYLAYIQRLVSESEPLLAAQKTSRVKTLEIAYTSMHGVGHQLLTSVLEIATSKRHIHPVEAQMQPDPEFPTVRLPNPEEAGALDLAFETAANTQSTLILALDPDADRCAAGLFEPASNQRRLLTGNELGQLLGWWAWHLASSQARAPATSQHDSSSSASRNSKALDDDDQDEEEEAAAERDLDANLLEREQSIETDKTPATPIRRSEVLGSAKSICVQQQQQPSQKPVARSSSQSSRARCKPGDCYMLSTAVSSRFLATLAKSEGFQFVETLTGFKYMGNLADELQRKSNKRVLFAYEEALGYLVDAHILDKDGLSAALQVVRCASYLAKLEEPRTLADQLDWLYWKYGYHFSLNSYFKCDDPRIIRAIFHELQSNYPKSFKCPKSSEEFPITRLRDLNTGIDTGTPDHKAKLPISSSSFMVTFWIGELIRFTVRTSGTEPKIKYYSEIVAEPLAKLASSGGASQPQWDAAARKALEEQKRQAQARLERFLEVALERCLRPTHYKLERALA